MTLAAIVLSTAAISDIFCIFAAGLSVSSCQLLLNKTKRYARLANGNVRNFPNNDARECDGLRE